MALRPRSSRLPAFARGRGLDESPRSARSSLSVPERSSSKWHLRKGVFHKIGINSRKSLREKLCRTSGRNKPSLGA